MSAHSCSFLMRLHDTEWTTSKSTAESRWCMATWFKQAQDRQAEQRRRRQPDEGGTEHDAGRMERIAERADAAVLATLRAYAEAQGQPDTMAQRTSSSSWSVGALHVEATPRGLEVASRTAERHPDQDALAAVLSTATGWVTRSSVRVAFYDSTDFTRFAPKGGRVGPTYRDGKTT